MLEVPGTEADDVMATLARLGAEAGHEVVLVTGDKDMLQVVGPHVKVMVPQTRDQYAILDAEGVKAKWGVGPGEHSRRAGADGRLRATTSRACRASARRPRSN